MSANTLVVVLQQATAHGPPASQTARGNANKYEFVVLVLMQSHGPWIRDEIAV